MMLLLINSLVFAQLSASSIDSLVTATMKAFDVPGIAVGIVKDGKLVFANGYGVRSITTGMPVKRLLMVCLMADVSAEKV